MAASGLQGPGKTREESISSEIKYSWTEGGNSDFIHIQHIASGGGGEVHKVLLFVLTGLLTL